MDGLNNRLNGNGQQIAVYARTYLGDKGYFSSLIGFDEHLVETQRQLLTAHTSARCIFGSETSFNAAFVGAEAAPFTVAEQSLNGTYVRLGSRLSYQTLNGW